MYKHSYTKRVMGQTSHPLYKTYEGMIQRCHNVINRDYPNYGGRGIRICEEWRGTYGFQKFADYMGDRPEGMTLDRIDNDKGYEPGNVRWADKRTQSINTRIRCTNTSGFKGICWEKRRNKWHSRLFVNYKSIHVGYFDDINEAVAARDNRMRELV